MTEDREPQEGDYVIFNHGPLYSLIGVSSIGVRGCETFLTYGDAYRAIRQEMDMERYWPDVWFEDDHGGVEIITAGVMKCTG